VVSHRVDVGIAVLAKDPVAQANRRGRRVLGKPSRPRVSVVRRVRLPCRPEEGTAPVSSRPGYSVGTERPARPRRLRHEPKQDRRAGSAPARRRSRTSI
jgi:hypothetical protein